LLFILPEMRQSRVKKKVCDFKCAGISRIREEHVSAKIQNERNKKARLSDENKGGAAICRLTTRLWLSLTLLKSV